MSISTLSKLFKISTLHYLLPFPTSPGIYLGVFVLLQGLVHVRGQTSYPWIQNKTINLYINLYIYYLFGLLCLRLLVCLYQIHVNTAEPIGPNFWINLKKVNRRLNLIKMCLEPNNSIKTNIWTKNKKRRKLRKYPNFVI